MPKNMLQTVVFAASSSEVQGRVLGKFNEAMLLPHGSPEAIIWPPTGIPLINKIRTPYYYRLVINEKGKTPLDAEKKSG